MRRWRSRVRRAFLCVVLVLTMVVGTAGTARADNPDGSLPAHELAAPTCLRPVAPYNPTIFNDPVFIYPVAGTNTLIIGPGTFIGSEWVYYRVWVAWELADGWHYAASNWIAMEDGYTGATYGTPNLWAFQDGQWVQLPLSSFGQAQNPAWGITVYPGTYWVGAEIYWSPIGSFQGLDHFQWTGQITCTNV